MIEALVWRVWAKVTISDGVGGYVMYVVSSHELHICVLQVSRLHVRCKRKPMPQASIRVLHVDWRARKRPLCNEQPVHKGAACWNSRRWKKEREFSAWPSFIRPKYGHLCPTVHQISGTVRYTDTSSSHTHVTNCSIGAFVASGGPCQHPEMTSIPVIADSAEPPATSSSRQESKYITP